MSVALSRYLGPTSHCGDAGAASQTRPYIQRCMASTAPAMSCQAARMGQGTSEVPTLGNAGYDLLQYPLPSGDSAVLWFFVHARKHKHMHTWCNLPEAIMIKISQLQQAQVRWQGGPGCGRRAEWAPESAPQRQPPPHPADGIPLRPHPLAHTYTHVQASCDIMCGAREQPEAQEDEAPA